MKLGGIDEAGRGPVIGPLVIATVVVDEKNLDRLRELNVRDSKKISPKRREELFNKIIEILDDYVVIELWPEEIDNRNGTLNEFEVENFIKALNSLKIKPEVLYIDAADVKEERFGEVIKKKLDFSPKIVSEHKADDKYLPVSAASILAKVTRDRAIEKLKEEYGEIGSGYPSDPRTRKFLEEYYLKYGDFPPIARRTWKTLKKLEEKLKPKLQKSSKKDGQLNITEFLR
ncbi:ribonuclease HII [Palaeococcus pacificus DY20341]|uniref:Ribonuclease HII n=1 Tax=Palaeococcus pacificus DY20341 TaxID=1343739 RepID=A0A075LXE3_9EURY|nr:ribonuclease HII [Palaeococcus pacificus]AIF69228.1 ribonuclease HII [Palaeococcus pacificus DY20341]